MARVLIYCDQNHSDTVIEQIVAACGGDMASTIQALLQVNEELESELQQLYETMAYRSPTNRSLH
jgi:hypothetical protein